MDFHQIGPPFLSLRLPFRSFTNYWHLTHVLPRKDTIFSIASYCLANHEKN